MAFPKVVTRVTIVDAQEFAWTLPAGSKLSENSPPTKEPMQMPPEGYPFFAWVVFFKIDGDSTFVTLTDGEYKLQGTATVVGTPGNHGDITPLAKYTPQAGWAAPNGYYAIPPSMGQYHTIVSPIPFGQGGPPVAPGVLGFVCVVLFQNETPDDDISAGHVAFNNAIQQALNALIPTLAMSQTITPAQIQAIESAVNSQVINAVRNTLSTANKLFTWLGFENQDSLIGSLVYHFTATTLADASFSGLSLSTQQIPPSNPAGIGAVTLHGAVTADAFPISLRRILSRVNMGWSARKAMASSEYAFEPSGSMIEWMKTTPINPEELQLPAGSQAYSP